MRLVENQTAASFYVSTPRPPPKKKKPNKEKKPKTTKKQQRNQQQKPLLVMLLVICRFNITGIGFARLCMVARKAWHNPLKTFYWTGVGK